MIKKINIPGIVLSLSAISFSTALNASTLCRNALYLAVFIAVIHFVLKKGEFKKDRFLWFIFTGILFIASLYFHGNIFISVKDIGVDEFYRKAALRLLFGLFIVFYLRNNMEKITPLSWKVAQILVVIGYTYLTIQAIYIHKTIMAPRLEIKTLSTTVAYVYAIQALLTIYIVSHWKKSIRFIPLAIVISVSAYVLMLTQTRSVMLSFPFFIVFYLLLSKKIEIKLIVFLITLALLGTLSNWTVAQNAFSRILYTQNEIIAYKNENGNTSLGSRFSIWKSGVYAFIQHPLGQSTEQRNLEASKYVNIYENGNPEALRVIPSHLHSDLADTISLRGIIGIVLLICFYISLSIVTIKHSWYFGGFILLVLPNIIFGLTDTLFIDLRCVTVLIMGLPFYLLVKKKEELRGLS
ncbi:O-antigen ligase family protein [Enterobacteriaceae bacterium LUAb1]